jgi:hypothetical protein
MGTRDIYAQEWPVQPSKILAELSAECGTIILPTIIPLHQLIVLVDSITQNRFPQMGLTPKPPGTIPLVED